MKKILAPLPYENWGGLHTMISSTHLGLKKEGFSIIPVIPPDAKAVIKRFNSQKVFSYKRNLSRIRKSWNLFLHFRFLIGIFIDINELGKIIKTKKIDIIQVSGIKNFHFAIAAKIFRCSLVWQIHSDALPYILRSLLLPIAKLLSNIIMVNGKEVEKKFKGLKSYPTKRISYFYPGINTKDYSFTNFQIKKARKLLSIKKNDIVIGTIGNQGYAKRHDRIVAIIKKLKLHKNFKFIILGGTLKSNQAYYKKEVFDIAENLGFLKSKKLQIINPKDKVLNYLPAFNIFILTSEYEGLPISLIEAMASGLPVITTDAGSIKSAIKNNMGGFVVSATKFNLNQFTKLLTNLIKNTKKRKIYGSKNKRIVQKKYTLKRLIETHINSYQNALR